MATDTHERAFLDSIVEFPDDMMPRLIYADWLEEHGQEESAEFIRVQVKLGGDYAHHAENGHDHEDCPGCILRRRERVLLDGWSGKGYYLGENYRFSCLLKELGVASELCDWRFRRGFVEELTLPLSSWLTHGKQLVRSAPLRVVRLTGQLTGRFARWYSDIQRLAQDDEPRDNPVCRLHTLDLSSLEMLGRWQFKTALNGCYRPWRGLKRLILPNWPNPEERYRTHEIEQWKLRVPSLESVEFGRVETRGREN